MNSKLEAYGWQPFFQQTFDALDDERLSPGRVVLEQRGLFQLEVGGEAPLEAVPAGRLLHLAAGAHDLPVVGDWVAYERPDPGGVALVHAVLPRRSKLSRKVAGARAAEQLIAANVDVVFLVMGLDGDFNLRRLERFLALAAEGDVRPLVILNKTDLCAEIAERVAEARSVALGAPVLAISAAEGGVEAVEAALAPRETAALVGSSGVGKSTIINRLLGREALKTAAVRRGDDRGRHTTTHRELYRLPGGALLIDNPGVRELQLWGADDGLDEAFHDIEELASSCRFRDCAHSDEPGCAVREAIGDGRLDSRRLENLRALEREAAALERRRDVRARRESDRRTGKLYKAIQAEKYRRRH